MTRIDRSPEQLDAEAAASARNLADAIHSCDSCGNPYLEGYPHRHEKPVTVAYDPMPNKPTTREGLVAFIRREYLAEVPARLHVQQVPSHAEPIGVSQYSAEAAGFIVVEQEGHLALDVGELGSPPWSVPFHRRIGSYRFWEGEVVQAESELLGTPWTRNLNGVRRWCAGKHRTWYEHRGEPLCWILVRLHVEGGYIIPRAVEKLAKEGFAVTVDKADKLVGDALDKWWAWTANDMNDLTMMRIRKPAA